MYRTNFIRVSVSTQNISLGFYRIEVVVVARKENQPAVQAASCAAASRLCRHSAQAHTPYNASVLSRVLKKYKNLERCKGKQILVGFLHLGLQRREQASERVHLKFTGG